MGAAVTAATRVAAPKLKRWRAALAVAGGGARRVVVIHTYQYSLSKVAAAVARRLGAYLHPASSLPPDGHYIIVSTALDSDLRAVVGHAVNAERCVAYLVAEGVPRVNPRRRETVQRCHVVVPSAHVRGLLEAAGFRVDAVVPHAVEWREAAARAEFPLAFIGVNLYRKGLDVAVKVAGILRLPMLVATTREGHFDVSRWLLPRGSRVEHPPPGGEYGVYARAAALLLPSRAEGFSLAPREFVASTGRCAVVTDLPVYGDEPGLLKCRAGGRYVHDDGHQVIDMVEPDPHHCAELARAAVAGCKADAGEMRRMYPPSLYDRFLEFLGP